MKKNCHLISILILFSSMLLLSSCSSNRMNASYIIIHDQLSSPNEVIVSDKDVVREVANHFFKLKFNEITFKEWEQNFVNMDITLTFYNKYDIYVGKTEFYFVLKNQNLTCLLLTILKLTYLFIKKFNYFFGFYFFISKSFKKF